MAGLLNFGQDEVGSVAPQIRVSSRCARHLHHSSSCHHCVDVCPTNALELSDGKVVQNTNICTECGACAASCPMGAIKLKNNDINALHKYINTAIHKNSTAIIACQNVAHDIDNALFITCLVAADNSALLQTFAQGAIDIQLVCGDCRECPSHEVFPLVIHRQQALQQLLFTLKLSVHIRVLQSFSLEAISSSSTHNLGLSRSGVSRRNFFSRLWKQSNMDECATISVKENSQHDVSTVTMPPSPRIPDNWQQFIFALKQLRHLDNSDVKLPIFYRPQISDKCVGCGICASSCPTQALHRDTGDNLTKLRFTPALCVGCGICQDVCYCNAVNLTQRHTISLNESNVPQTLIEISLQVDGLETDGDKLIKLLGCPHIFRT
ncbi:4Fe-4S binding protein [Shewanella yunxiaonensis]|uniref:4Fe-4S binding protein n=1 Tax=Shewanella yunxiaonensis TaxID=2829809 RepID=A0ABX7YWP7_9GAMM|nr:4Fe-4S binding protein [Shewanella yunxiaonensis]QUN07102.1 4Fe-4S binding protein [Shewanella yunxiaonensis]